MTNIHKYKDRQHNDQKKNDKKTKHYTENYILSNANPIKNVGCSRREEIAAPLVIPTRPVTVKRHAHYLICKSCWAWVWNLGEISMVYTFKILAVPSSLYVQFDNKTTVLTDFTNHTYIKYITYENVVFWLDNKCVLFFLNSTLENGWRELYQFQRIFGVHYTPVA